MGAFAIVRDAPFFDLVARVLELIAKLLIGMRVCKKQIEFRLHLKWTSGGIRRLGITTVSKRAHNSPRRQSLNRFSEIHESKASP